MKPDFQYCKDSYSSIAMKLSHLFGQLHALGSKSFLEQQRQGIENLHFRVVVCGEFKRGKSTLINALLGKRVSPMKVAPCTAVVMEFVEAKKQEFAQIYFQNPDAIHSRHKNPNFSLLPTHSNISDEQEYIETDIDDVQNFVQISNPVRKGMMRKRKESLSSTDPVEESDKKTFSQEKYVERARIYVHSDVCKNGVWLIDSPGLNENNHRTGLSLSELCTADAIIMVLSCEMALSLSEQDFLQFQLFNDRKDNAKTTTEASNKGNVFYLWNRFDAVWDSEEEIVSINDRSQKYLEPYLKYPHPQSILDIETQSSQEIFYISAKEALVGVIKKDRNRYQKSGIPKFMSTLQQFLQKETRTQKFIFPHGLLVQSLQHFQDRIIKRHRLCWEIATLLSKAKKLGVNGDNIEKFILQLSKDIRVYQIETLEDIEELQDEYAEEALVGVILELDSFFSTVIQDAYSVGSHLKLKVNATRQEREDTIIRHYRNWLSKSLTSLITEGILNKIDTFYEDFLNEISEMYDHFQNKVISCESQLHKKIEQLNKLQYPPIPKTKYLHFLQTHSQAMYESWKRNISKTLSTNIALDLLGSQTSALSISLLGIGTLQAWLTGETLEEQDKNEIGNVISRGLQSQREPVIVQFKSQIDLLFSSLVQFFSDQVQVDATDFRRQLKFTQLQEEPMSKNNYNHFQEKMKQFTTDLEQELRKLEEKLELSQYTKHSLEKQNQETDDPEITTMFRSENDASSQISDNNEYIVLGSSDMDD